MDCFWSWEELQIYRCSRNCQSFWFWQMCGLAAVPHLHWLWQDVLFGGSGKKTAWNTWTTCRDVISEFCALGAMPDPSAIDEWMQPLEGFVVLLYDCTSTEDIVNQARKQLFSKKGRAIDGLLFTHAAFSQHIKRAARHRWAQMKTPESELSSPSECGWNKKPGGG